MGKPTTYGQRLRYAREMAGLTQEQLAKVIGQRPTAVSAVEQGLAKRSSRTVQIANALGVRPEWLEHGRDPMTRLPQPSTEAMEVATQYDALPPQGKAAIRALLLAYGPAVSDERVADFIKPAPHHRR